MAISARPVTVLLTTALVGSCLSACGGPDHNDVAKALADGLTKASLAEVPFESVSAKVAQAELGTITAGLGKDAREQVTVTKVSEPQQDADGVESAAASLKHTWTVPTAAAGTSTITWSYDTTANLTKGEKGWAVRWAPSVVADLSKGEKLKLGYQRPPRADIVGAANTTLVTNRPIVRFGIDKSKVSANDAPTSAKALAKLVAVEPDPYAQRVAKAGAKQFVPAITMRADQVPAEVTAGVAEIPGALGVKDEAPLAPTKEFARPLLGVVGEATAEYLKKNPGYQAGDEVGLSGLQATYQSRLAGKPGVEITARLAGQTTPRLLFETEPKAGSAVTTTLNEKVQNTAESLVADLEPASAVLVVKPSTGEVLAAASGPGGKGYSTATLGQYAPGSTFKVVTSLALLRKGLTPDSEVSCPGSITVDGRSFGNDSDFPADGAGTMTLREALARSCNTAFIGEALNKKLTPDDLASAAASLGFDWDPKASGAAVFTGNLPTDTTATEKAAAFIGQGKVTASPLAMSAIASSVQQGSTVVPRLVTTPAPIEGKAPAKPLTSAEASALQSMMRAVVTSGTGTRLSSLPGEVIAKTGTAEYGSDNPPKVHAWMIAAKGDLAAVVMVANGQSGARTAGPIMQQLLSSL